MDSFKEDKIHNNNGNDMIRKCPVRNSDPISHVRHVSCRLNQCS